ncbi:AMIN domain-containing protein [Oscillatoria sp. CS-180]|uniref:AMIN domain-containing protein n=1 Tax=Oscillatoria sp. CS-180 TaxID=3021720 RepID=UPI00232C2C61|nr:AMIN domain-containing protein [Oscillatoria sp. CS-180]MDB9529259.1 AMIN domain-containing protein [Oscillatoria sp. CS-180]
MKRLLGYGSCLAGSTLLALAAQPVYATSTMITGVEVIPTDGGAQIILQTEAGDVPEVFAVNQGHTLRADIVRTQLRLAEGEQFVQQNPAPGIEAIALTPLDGNSVRLTVDGSDRIPMGTIGESSNGGIIIDVAAQPEGTVPQASTPVPDELVTVPGEPEAADDIIAVPNPETVAQAETPDAPPETLAEPEEATEGEVDSTAPQPDVLVPNPQVIIEGVPVPAPEVQVTPPFLPAAVAPPVGDIAVSETVPDFGVIDLGTAERVPRLVLRDAPSREVLSLLARAAGLNLVFIDANGQEETEEAAAAAAGEGPPISLDIENESVQDVFNSVLRVTGLQANRVGRTIYVGPNLPTSAQNIVVRSLRLNQIDAAVASNFLVGLGAESAVSRERQVTSVNAVSVEEGVPPITETQTTTEERIETQRAEYEDSNPIFRGLQVIAEERTNSVTLVGSPQLVELATAQLVRLDLRRRQVAVNVKVIDIDLNALDAFGTSFSFSIGNFDFASQGGVGVINFGGQAPGGTGSVPEPGVVPIGPQDLSGNNPALSTGDFLFQVLATVQEGNGKILTDPTLIVQEGQTASVQLTEDVITDFEVDQEVTDTGQVSQTLSVETEPAGLILQVDVQRIDDNGFVTLSVAPSISAPTGVATFGFTGVDNAFVTLLAERQLSSGQIRVRDGQTLVLSGIIQETDRTTVTKVPILGDLPLLGALFRSTNRENSRQELVVLLTPQILDDSEESTFGYSYTPSEEVQELLER